MRVRDDPRAAAELFCRQHGVTDTETINLLEETLRGLYFPSPSPPPSSTQSPPPPPETSAIKAWPRTPEETTGPSMHSSLTRGTSSGEPVTDNAEDVTATTSTTSEAAPGAHGDDTSETGGPSQTRSEPSSLAAAQVLSDAAGAVQRAVMNHHRERQVDDKHHDQQNARHGPSHNSYLEGEQEDTAAAAAATSAAESPSEVNVPEVAARMRGKSKQASLWSHLDEPFSVPTKRIRQDVVLAGGAILIHKRP